MSRIKYKKRRTKSNPLTLKGILNTLKILAEFLRVIYLLHNIPELWDKLIHFF